MQIEQSQKNQIEQSPKNIEDIEIRNQKAFDLVNGINKNDIDIMLDTLGFDNNIKGYDEIGKKEAIYNFLKDNEKGKNMNLDDVKEKFIKFKKINDVVGKFNLQQLDITKQLLGFKQT
jgi:hypothetical protein